MAEHLDAALATVAAPDAITPDPKAGRWRYWRAEAGPTRWLFVVVQWKVEMPAVITAFGQPRVRL
jgi:hypothetical protein